MKNNRESKICTGGGINSHNVFDNIISLRNLFAAWREFQKGKLNKKDVFNYSRCFEENILNLREKLNSFKYRHGGYNSFYICDPKRRHIHKATMNDRVVHRAIYRILYGIFDRTFMFDSYSSRVDKGVLRAINRFNDFTKKLSENNTKKVWILKCDIRRYFDSIDHSILMKIIFSKINDKKAFWLIGEVINSFGKDTGKGLPLGNVTSQIFSNIYLNELDQYIKRRLRIKYYIRYADDFVILSQDKEYLESLLSVIKKFLFEKLKLELHPDKIFLKDIYSGVDFLGWVNFLKHRILRTKTKKRILGKLKKGTSDDTINSYLGMLRRGNTRKIKYFINENFCKNKTTI